MDASVERVVWQQRVATAVLGVFETIALCLACWLPVWRVLRHMELTRTLRDPA